MQPGLYGAHRDTHKLLNFFQFIAFGIVQQHDQPMFVAELLERLVELQHFVKSLVIADRIVAAGQSLEPVAGQHAFFHGVQAAARETALVVDEKVVHHATEPGPRLVDLHEIVDLAVGLDKEFLEQVLGLGLLAGQSPGEPVQAVEVRPDDAFEGVAVLGDDGLLQAFKVPPATR